MKRLVAVTLALAISAVGSSALDSAAAKPGSPLNAVSTPRLAYSSLPLTFEANRGQSDPSVKFLARGQAYAVFLTRDEAILKLGNRGGKSGVLRLTLLDSNPAMKVMGTQELPGQASYFIGKDAKQWRTSIPTYAKVRYEGVYPGVDLVYYGNGRQLEYDFVVAAGADPKAIRLRPTVRAAQDSQPASLQIDTNGDLVISLPDGEVRFQKPVVYQTATTEEHGDRRLVAGGFVLLDAHTVGFDIAAYDKSLPLVIDPILAYSTYYGGSEQDTITSIAVDGSGNAYVTGYTNSFADFPTNTSLSPNNGSTTDDTNTDAFVSKINPEGTGYVWSTYLGGTSHDWGWGIALDSSENVYVTGGTASENFPLENEFDDDQTGNVSVFVTKIAPDASSILYSTYLSATFNNNRGIAIAADDSGNAYLTGEVDTTPGFPERNGFVTDHCDTINRTSGFISRIDTTKSGDASLIYSTIMCGNFTTGFDIAADGIGNAYVTGTTDWPDFPMKNGFQAECNCEPGQPLLDAFFVKVDTDASGLDSLVYSTFISGTGEDTARGLALDADGFVYIHGTTNSTDFPVTDGALQPTLNGNSRDTYVLKIDPGGVGEGSLVWSTYLGGTGFDVGSSIALDVSNNIYLAGYTASADFPTRNAPLSFAGGVRDTTLGEIPSDAYALKLKPDASALLYGTFLGGSHNEEVRTGVGLSFSVPPAIAVDASGNAYVAGSTRSDDFPAGEPGVNAYFNTLQGTIDGFIAKLVLNPDFSLDAITDITLELSESDTRTVTVNSLDAFNAAVTLSVPDPPAGFVISFATNPITPPADGAVSTTMTVALGLATLPGNYTLAVTGSAGTLSRSTPIDVTVEASISGTSDVIDGLTALGCIDNSGIAGALLSKLAQAQAFIDTGKTQAAINTLTALLNQLHAQAGKHIATSCTEDGVTFDPTEVLIAQVEALLQTLGPATADPIMGYVLTAKGGAVASITVTLFPPSGPPVAAVRTDVTGFYFFPETGRLAPRTTYTTRLSTIPKPYKNVSPAFQQLTWTASATTLRSFVLN